MKRSELQAWLREGWENGLSFLCANNPRAVYDFIKRNYGNNAFQTWEQGVEMFDGAQQSLYDFMERKALQTGMPEKFVGLVSTYIPYNEKATDELGKPSWTVVQSDNDVLANQGIAEGEYHPKQNPNAQTVN